MARDDHYNIDLPVFYKNYELPRHQVRTVFSSRFYHAHDVLDTIFILSVVIMYVWLTLRIMLPSPSVTFYDHLPSVLLHRLS